MLGKTSQGEGVVLLILTESDKILASCGLLADPDCDKFPVPVSLVGHTRGTQSPSLCVERLVETKVPLF